MGAKEAREDANAFASTEASLEVKSLSEAAGDVPAFKLSAKEFSETVWVRGCGVVGCDTWFGVSWLG